MPRYTNMISVYFTSLHVHLRSMIPSVTGFLTGSVPQYAEYFNIFYPNVFTPTTAADGCIKQYMIRINLGIGT